MLTPKQKLFVEEYLVDLNATQAAIRAGYSVKTANRIGAENLSKPDIQKEIEKRRKDRERRTEITQDRVLQELAAIAFAKATDYAEIDEGIVKIKPTSEISIAQAGAIAGVEQGNFGVKLKLYDKLKALELLGKHIGIFCKSEEKEEERGRTGVVIIPSIEDKGGGFHE